jgi:hypothetical protein
MSYDPSRQRSFLTTAQNEQDIKMWVYTAPTRPAVGTITSMPLIQSSGTTWGTNNYGNPFARFTTQKHVNITYCPLNNRIYCFGGDFGPQGSAADGMWSMDCTTGAWRVEARPPIMSGFPSPSAFQDTTGFFWDSVRSRIVVVPRGHTGYSHNVIAYAKGYWFYDPLTADATTGMPGTWTQDLRLFNTTTGTQGSEFQMSSGTDQAWGGVYDSTTQIVYALKSSDRGGPLVKRWNLGTGAAMTDLGFSPSNLGLWAGGRSDSATFLGGCSVGRFAYWMVINGLEIALVRLGFDTGTFTRLANCVVDPRQTYIPYTEATTRLVGCGSTHIVYIPNEGPEGSFPGIHVYNIAKDRWSLDTQVPWTGRFTPYSDGTIRYNAGCIGEGPNNGVAFCGTVFSTNSSSVTHMLFYSPTGVSA